MYVLSFILFRIHILLGMQYCKENFSIHLIPMRHFFLLNTALSAEICYVASFNNIWKRIWKRIGQWRFTDNTTKTSRSLWSILLSGLVGLNLRFRKLEFKYRKYSWNWEMTDIWQTMQKNNRLTEQIWQTDRRRERGM